MRGRAKAGTLAALPLVAALGCTPEAAEPAPVDAADEPAGAVLVEELARGSPLASAGLAPGDRLIGWRRGEASGSFDSWDDLRRLELEQAPRGPVRVEAERGGRRFEVELREDRWRARARPALVPAAAALHRSALAALAARDAAAARELFAALGDRLSRPADRAWLELRAAALPASVPGADPWDRALAAAAAASDPALVEWVTAERCAAATRAARFAVARAACERALVASVERGSPLGAVHVRLLLADLAGREGDPREEERRYREVLSNLEPIAPESLLVARALRGLAKARATQDDLDGAFEHAGRALALVERSAPRTLEHEAVLVSLAIFHWFRAEWRPAEARLVQALEILQAIDPGHEEMANVVGNLAVVAGDRGDLAGAEQSYLRSLELQKLGASDPLQESRTYNNLATLAARRGDLATAVAYDLRVLELRERIAPQSIDLTPPLINLGEHLRRAGNPAAAVGHLERALEIQRRHVPASRDEAVTLVALGEALAAAEDARAEPTLVEALALAERVAPDSTIAAEALRALGARRSAEGELAAAEEMLGRAVAILARRTPGTVEEALALLELGRVRRLAGRPAEALAALSAAAAALDRQLTTLGGTDELRARFRESWRHVYEELADLLREAGRPEQAFEVLERSRSRAFLFLLRAREIDVAAGLPAELVAERAAVVAADERIQERLDDPATARDSRAVAELRARRRELHQRRDRLAERVGRWSPRLAGLEAALGVDAARAALGDAATAISYSVDERTTRAWIVGPGGQFEVVDLGVGESELRDLVERFRLLLETTAPGANPAPLGRQLHRRLIAPIADRVRTPELVLVPDGPLHHLPFAALVVGGPDEAPRYLVEWKPLQIAGSLTAWAELRRRAGGAARSLVAFGDPSPSPTSRTIADARASWGRLPHGRREAERVADLFGGAGRAHVGRAATEAEAKRVGEAVRYLHFATHAYVDASSPLDSALVLAPATEAGGRREDGLLQGWEVLLELRLAADLVVLSGCETGGGALVADEGILGLTRAFHFAGARAVVASFWPVSDRATARLMERFYGELAAGRPADEALRAAQLTLLAQPNTASPLYWAAFQLYGATPEAGESPIVARAGGGAPPTP